jgi:hypothetical protein
MNFFARLEKQNSIVFLWCVEGDLKEINFHQIFSNLVFMLVNTNTCNPKVVLHDVSVTPLTSWSVVLPTFFISIFVNVVCFLKLAKVGSLYCMHYSFPLVLFGVMFVFHSCCWNDVHK